MAQKIAPVAMYFSKKECCVYKYLLGGSIDRHDEKILLTALLIFAATLAPGVAWPARVCMDVMIKRAIPSGVHEDDRPYGRNHRAFPLLGML